MIDDLEGKGLLKTYAFSMLDKMAGALGIMGETAPVSLD